MGNPIVSSSRNSSGRKPGKADRSASYMGMVRTIASGLSRRLPPRVDRDELVQNGMLALVETADRYQELGALQFEALARQRIRGAMIDGLRVSDWLSRRKRTRATAIRTLAAAAEARHGQQTLGQLAQRLEIEPQELAAILRDEYCGTLVFFGEIGDGSVNAVESIAAAYSPSAQDVAESRQLLQRIWSAVEAMPEKQRLAAELHFAYGLSQKEIAGLMRLTAARVSQLLGEAVATLRREFARHAVEADGVRLPACPRQAGKPPPV